MNGPNKVVASWRARKWAVISSHPVRSEDEGLVLKEELKKQNPDKIVKLSSYKVGPRRAPITEWIVRVYQK